MTAYLETLVELGCIGGYCLGGCRVDPRSECLPAHVAAADITRCDQWQHCHFFV